VLTFHEMESTLELSELKFEGVTLSLDEAAALPRPLKVWLLLDSLSANYSGFLLTARATRLIPLDSVVRLTAIRETAGRPERQSRWTT
jgi:hypothetical protein